MKSRSVSLAIAAAVALPLCGTVIPGVVVAATTDMNTVTYALPNDIKDWDPAVIYSSEVRSLLNVYETLTRFDPETGEAAPLLATEWSKSEDGLTWTFTLRKDVFFHDGSPFNAEAAKISLDRTIEMGKGASYIWAGVESIEAPEPQTLVIKTKHPMAIDLIASSGYAAYMISPTAAEKGGDWFAEGHADGTGPYQLAQYDKGQQLVLEKFGDYWGGWEDNQFDRIVVRFVQETSTQVQMVRGGEADIVISPPRHLLKDLRSEEDVHVGVFDSWLNLPLSINVGKYPTDNLKFRQALTYLMDYSAISKDIFAGTGEVPHSCVAPSIPGAGRFDLPTYDPQKARQLLEESGIPEEDWKVTYYAYTGNQSVMEVAEMFQALAAQAGVTVEVETGEWGVLWDRQKDQATAANLFPVLWWADWPSAASWLKTLWHTEDPTVWNFSHYSSPEYDSLVDEAAALQGADREASNEKFVEAQQMILDGAVGMCLVDLKRVILYSDHVTGVDYNPAYETVSAYKLRVK